MVVKKVKRFRRYTKKVKRANLPVTHKELKIILHKNQEIKNLPVFTSNTTFTYGTGAVVNPLTFMTQNTGSASRVGEEITAVKLRLRITATVGDVYNQVRLIIFQWHQDSGVGAPSWTDILDSNSISSSAYSYQAGYNSVQKTKYRILWDKQFALHGNGTANYPITSNTTRHFIVNIPAKRFNKRLIFNGTATSASNHLYFLAISDSGVLPNPVFSYGGFFDYTDA